MKLSVVIPTYNERGNILELSKEISRVLDQFEKNYEVIIVNDGSCDGTGAVLEDVARNDSRYKIIEFKRNFGQTAALAAGIDMAGGDIIVTIDADLENDPSDIPKLLRELGKDCDIVSGWRKTRWSDQVLTRRLTSNAASWLISKVAGLRLHDYGCTLKAYRREVIKDLKLYGEMHRLIPAYAYWRGARVKELVVSHRARKYGKSKYGMSRSFRVLLDLLTLKFFTQYASKPMHFFGYIGYWLISFSFLSGTLAVYLRFFHGISFILTPLPLLTVFLIIVGIQFILMGLLAEILIRIKYRVLDMPTYFIKRKINF